MQQRENARFKNEKFISQGRVIQVVKKRWNVVGTMTFRRLYIQQRKG